MRNQTCCLTGHRRIDPTLYPIIAKNLNDTVEYLIKNGYRYFGTGGALGFDTMAAQCVLKLKEKYPYIKLILVLPCLSQTNHWNKNDIAIYETIKSKADKVVYTSKEYTKDCMFKRNRHLVDNSSICVCYLTKTIGGTAYTINYAAQQGIRIINLS